MSSSLKKFYFFFLLIIAVNILPTITEYFNNEESTGFNDYARITDVDYKAVLVDEPNQGGKVIITEKITFDVHAASKNNLFWELWRDLPEDNVDGLLVDYDVTYVKQLNNDGSETIYEESPKLYWDDSDYTSDTYGPGKWYHSPGPYDENMRRYECVLFYVNGLYREKVTFEIQYVMNNASLRYSDVSELYLSMYSEETIKHLKSFKGQILIPNKDMPKEGNYLAHTYGTNSHTFDYTESDLINPGYHTFSFNLDKDDLHFKKYNQYIEFSLLSFNDDRHIFTNYAPSNNYSNDIYLEEALEAIKEYDNLPSKSRKNKVIVLIISILISFLTIRYVINRDKKIRKQHMLYEPTTPMLYFRDIPSDLDPHFAATLVFSKDKHKVDMGDSYSALMLDLVRKGYIELKKIDETKDWVFNNITINVLYKPSLTNVFNKPNYNSNNINNNYNNTNTINNNINNISNLNSTINNLRNNSTQLTISDKTSLSTLIQKAQNRYNAQTNPQEINTNSTPLKIYNINGKELEKLTYNEESYFNLIVRHSIGHPISLEAFQQQVSSDYDNTNTFVTSIDKSIVNIGINKGYFQKADYNNIKNSTIDLSIQYKVWGLIIMIVGNILLSQTRLDFAFGSLFIIGLVLIITSIYLAKMSNKYVLFTQYGEDEYAKWRGLYNFLNSETLMKERTVIELPLWEKYLVYATAFGISEKVIKVLEISYPNNNDIQNIDNYPVLSNNYYRSNNFRINNRSFKTATHHASSISRSGRSYGGGSYYGGGGRGGGGGGGGH